MRSTVLLWAATVAIAPVGRIDRLSGMFLSGMAGLVESAPHAAMQAPSGATAGGPALGKPASGEATFGEKLTIPRAKAVSVTRAVTDRALRGRRILVTGTISDVCQNKGCWLVVDDGKNRMRVTFKDYAFFVPKDSDGRTVYLEGIVSREEISADEARHYAGESKSTGERKKKFRSAQQVITMEASGVVIAGA